MKIPLMTIVKNFVDSSDVSVHQARRLYNIGKRGAREFNMDIQGQFKTVLLDVTANGTVAFPADYLKYCKLGILNSVGEFTSIKHNPDLSTLHEAYINGVMTAVPSTTDLLGSLSTASFPFYWINCGWGDLNGQLQFFGIPGGTATLGEFTIDEANKCFLLREGWQFGTIMLEYLSDGYDCECEDFMVDTFAEEAMMCYLRWRNAQDLRKKYSTGDVNYYKREYYREKSLARLRIANVNINEMQDVVRSHITLTAKA